MHIAFFKELGANPTPMSWGELYTALQQGTVDAQENPYAMIDDGKFYEVQKYVSETGHVFSFEVLIANKKFIDKLPADLRTLVLKAAKDATIQQRKNMQKEEGAFKAKVIKAGMAQLVELIVADKLILDQLCCAVGVGRASAHDPGLHRLPRHHLRIIEGLGFDVHLLP